MTHKRTTHTWLISLVAIVLNIRACLADDSSEDGLPHNPILAIQPPFAQSLPVQILLTGIVFTLTAVLLVHLIFTAQYHWPLAPVNYALQLSSVLTLFISLIATINVIFSQTIRDSHSWPYMLTYLAINIPQTPNTDPSTDGSPVYGSTPWGTAELTAWYVMDATTSALVQITHIQFLTLLYPSYLEKRLILGLLGPLAVVSAFSELLPIHQSQMVSDIADTVRNTCNAALSLLFTTALVVWGFLVNRKQAWRTDGGTAAFGAGALALALVSTGLSFLYIPTRRDYIWLPRLIWAVVLWQSFLGWWWWVGGGRGLMEVEELMRREERRDKKRKARAARRTVRKEKAQKLWRNASETLRFGRRTNGNGAVNAPTAERELIEMADRAPALNADHDRGRESEAASTLAASTSTTAPTTTGGIPQPAGVLARLASSPPMVAVSQFYRLLRRAHLVAARSQALERMRRRRAAYGGEADAPGVDGLVSDTNPVGWGLGSFGIREMERMEMSAEREDREGLVGQDAGEDGNSTSMSLGEMRGLERPPPPRPKELRPGVPPTNDRTSLWWVGPLRKWRLQDSTVY